MRPPVKYYGGKSRMLPHILPLIPEHETYLEAFCGGAAVFWAKPRSGMEVLNDVNQNVTNFYRVLKGQFQELEMLIKGTLHCEVTFEEAKDIYHNQPELDPVTRAWAFWVCANMAFGAEVGGSFQWAKNKSDGWHPAISVSNRRDQFRIYENRLAKVSIRSRPAEELIPAYNGCRDLFIYADPPYVGARQGHYEGYMQEDFDNLLNALSDVDGKFLLSSYENDSLDHFTNLNGWNTIKIKQRLGVASGNKQKTEVLTWNYEAPTPKASKTLSLFEPAGLL